MPTCKLCNDKFPTKITIDGKVRNLQTRKYCLNCSPFGCGNTKKLEKVFYQPSDEEIRFKQNDKYKKWQKMAKKG